MQFIDHYYNQTLKTLSILRWAHNKCQKSKIIVKTDDDSLVNIDMLLHNLNKFKSGITGFKHKNLSVLRDSIRWGKWYYPVEKYKPDYIPPHVYGSFYAITTDVISKLLETLETYSDPVLDLEDSWNN